MSQPDIFFFGDCAAFIGNNLNDALYRHCINLPGSPSGPGCTPRIVRDEVESKIKELYGDEQSAKDIWRKHKKQLISWAKEKYLSPYGIKY